MPARQARRPRRTVTASALPRPAAVSDDFADDPVVTTPATAPTASRAPSRRALGVRAHHVTEDYRYVRTDLLLVAAVAAVSMGFVVGMSFVL